MAGKKLTPKQERFCREYVVDLNATQAAIRAGFSAKTANEQGARMLAKVSIQAFIGELQAEVSQKLGITQEWVINRLKEISDRCMTAVPVLIRDGNGGWMESGEYQFDSTGANKATELLGKHLGVFEKDNSQGAQKIIVKLNK